MYSTNVDVALAPCYKALFAELSPVIATPAARERGGEGGWVGGGKATDADIKLLLFIFRRKRLAPTESWIIPRSRWRRRRRRTEAIARYSPPQASYRSHPDDDSARGRVGGNFRFQNETRVSQSALTRTDDDN